MALMSCTEINAALNRIAKIEQGLTIKDSINQSPVLCSDGKKIELIRAIIRIIEYFLKVTGKEMEAFQIQILAGDLYDRFYTDTIDDIILMFKMARLGEFGKIYKVDPLTVNLWPDLYLERKAIIREQLLKAEAEQRRKAAENLSSPSAMKFSELPTEMQEAFENIGKKRNENPNNLKGLAEWARKNKNEK